jgi:hypothetical protein
MRHKASLRGGGLPGRGRRREGGGRELVLRSVVVRVGPFPLHSSDKTGGLVDTVGDVKLLEDSFIKIMTLPTGTFVSTRRTPNAE